MRRRTKAIGRFPGKTSALSLIWAVLELTSRGWRGVVMTPKTVAEIERLRRRQVSAGGDEVTNEEEAVAAKDRNTAGATPTRFHPEDRTPPSARKELEAQLAVVREELSRLTAEERALTEALTSLDGDGRSAQTGATTRNRGERSPAARVTSPSRKTATGRRRRRGQSKPTAERVEELRGLLAEGPRSRADLAAALKGSPARVQQLLAALGPDLAWLWRASAPRPVVPRSEGIRRRGRAPRPFRTIDPSRRSQRARRASDTARCEASWARSSTRAATARLPRGSGRRRGRGLGFLRAGNGVREGVDAVR